jgi:hypothetical protein
VAAALFLALGLTLFVTATVQAHGLTTGLTDDLFASSHSSERATWLDRAVSAHAGMVGIPVHWRQTVGPDPPVAPESPVDPAYDFRSLDAAVSSASSRGLQPMLIVNDAPSWAEGKGSKRARYEGTWKPDPNALEAFAHALATRYSGSYPAVAANTGALGVLPRVRYFEVWSEANRTPLLEPQWSHGKPKSPELYRRLVNGFYAGIKSVRRDDLVIGPGLAPYGDPRNNPSSLGPRMRPLVFLRKLFCLKGRNVLKPRPCNHPVKLDIISHHPIGFASSPTRHAINPDDAGPADLRRVTRVVRAAERAGTLRPQTHHRELWATETWWVSKPPSRYGVPLRKQAKWVEQGLYVFWRDGASVAIQQPLRDASQSALALASGLFFRDGTPKPAYRAFSFPFVGHRRSKHQVGIWGKAPASGELRVEKKGRHAWRTAKRLQVRRGEVFTSSLRLRGHAKLRAELGDSTSLVWRQH